MAAFPAIEPLRRAWSFGSYPITRQPSSGVGSVQFRHGLQPSGHVLTLTFEQLSQSEVDQIRAHYVGQRGGVIAFDVPPIVWRASTSSSGPINAPLQWRYADRPQEDHKSGSLGNVSVELEAVFD